MYNDPVAGLNGIEAAAAGYGLGAQGVGVQTYGAGTPKAVKTLESDAKKAGMPAPPEAILLDLKHKARLDGLSQQHPKDPKGRLKAYIKYAAEEGNDHFGGMLAHVDQMPDEQAKSYGDQVRSSLVGPGLSQYEAAVKERLKAQGK